MTTVIKADAYKQLKNEIERRGIKNKFVADKISITPNYLGQILGGKRNLTADVAIRARQVLGLLLYLLLTKS